MTPGLIPQPDIGYSEQDGAVPCLSMRLALLVTLRIDLLEEPTMAGPLTITASNFETEVLQATTPVLLDFWAPWCSPCRMVAPAVEEMAMQYADKLKVGKLNVDDHPAVAQRYGITGIPALLFFEGGHVVDTVIGAVPKSTLQQHVDGVLGNA